MPWFRVDDGFYSSRKVTQIPRGERWSAIGLWTIAGTWSAKELTDGFIPDYQLEELGGRESDAENLVRVGLWVRLDDGYEFANWGEYQPTKAEIEAQREKEAERKRKWRESRGESRGTDVGQDAGHQAESGHPDPTRPDPTRPDPTSTSSEVERTAKRGTRIPTDWMPSPDLIAWATTQRPDLNVSQQVDAFRDYWTAQPGQKGVKLDWDATWRNWIRNARQSSRPAQATPAERMAQTLALASSLPELEEIA